MRLALWKALGTVVTIGLLISSTDASSQPVASITSPVPHSLLAGSVGVDSLVWTYTIVGTSIDSVEASVDFKGKSGVLVRGQSRMPGRVALGVNSPLLAKAGVYSLELNVKLRRTKEVIGSGATSIEVLPGIPSRFEVKPPLVQTNREGKALIPVSVQALDEAANPIPNVTVVLEPSEGLQVLTGGSATTDANGVAQFTSVTMKGKRGEHAVTVTSIPEPAESGSRKVLKVMVAVDAPDKILLDIGEQAKVKVGSPLSWIQARVIDMSGVAVVGQEVEIVVLDPDVRVENDGGELPRTNATGFVRFDHVRLLGAPGDYSIRCKAGDVLYSVPVRVHLVGGATTFLSLLRRPWPKLESDSLLRVQPTVLAADASGNPLSKQAVAVELVRVNVKGSKRGRAGKLYSVQGTTIRETDGDGIVRFDDLKFVGSEGTYVLKFYPATAQSPVVFSDTLIADPERFYNKSFVVVSAIKSIAGIKPDDEFFDIRFRFRLTNRLSSMAGTDISLGGRGTEDVTSGQSYVTDAAASLNIELNSRKNRETDVPERQMSVGGGLRIFNTLPYAEVGFGSTELYGSAFEGSKMSLSVLWAVDPQQRTVTRENKSIVIRSVPINLFGEFFLRSQRIPFFKLLTLRAGALIPLKKPVDVQTRIAVAIPIGGGDLHAF